MHAVKQGDFSALATLFDRHAAAVLNYLHRVTRDRESSRDLTQTVFERMLRYRASYQDDSRFRPWMYRIARNALADHWRQSGRIQAEELDADAVIEGDNWQQRRDAADLDEALQALRPADREVLVLHRFHGLGYAEIAEVTQKSVAAVKVQAHRALLALRRAYFGEEAGNEAE